MVKHRVLSASWLIVFWVILNLAVAEKPAEEEFPLENGVYVLSDSNFDKFFESHKTVLVEFYAPWCGHCKALAPEYEKAAKTLKSKSASVYLAKVDATKETALGTKYDIKGYPMLKFFKDGLDSSVEYDGPRDADGLVNWLEEKTDPNYKPPPEAVMTLTKENFTSIALGADIILVEFYAPWCGHCKQLAPEYEKAAKQLKNLPVPIPLAKVDGTLERDLASDYQVTGYPTMKLLRKGRRFEYAGPRDGEGIVKYMKEQSKPASKELKSINEAQKFMSQEDITIIGFFDKNSDEKLVENFKEACEALRDEFKSFAYTFDKDVVAHYKTSVNKIGIFYPEKYWSKYEPKFKFFEKLDASREDIVKFLLENCTPMVGQRTTTNQSKRYISRPLVVAYYTVDFSHLHRDGTQFWRQKILNVAKDYPSYRFAISDEESFATEMKDVGLADSGMDVNIVVFGKDNRRYVMNPDDFDEFTEESFRSFMKKLNDGRITAFMKSQPLPKDDKGPVKTLVSSNFDKIAKDNSKDVFIEFYAPWCGHFKSLEPIYKELAEKYKSEKNLIIAKFDATANDSPEHYKVEGFPTMYFAPSGRKDDPIKYTGGRTLEEMSKFLKENAAVAFKKTEL